MKGTEVSQCFSISDLQPASIREVAKIHQAAFPESALSALGTKALSRYYYWHMREPNDCIALAAQRGDELVGYCLAGVFDNGFLRHNILFLIWQVLCRPWVLLKSAFRESMKTGWQILKMQRKTVSSPAVPVGPVSPRFRILAVAVIPSCQGCGLGKELMNKVETVAHARGFAEVGLTVHPENSQAVSFYLGLGWQKIIYTDTWQGKMRKSLVYDSRHQQLASNTPNPR